MSLADDLLSEVCAEETERLPFRIGKRTVYAEEVSPRVIEAWQEDVRKARRNTDAESDFDFKARLIIRCVTDENRKLVFTPDHVERLANGRNRYVSPLYELCCYVNGIGETVEAILKKNSEPAPVSPSLSDSAVTLAG
jgi:hypothetical protein